MVAYKLDNDNCVEGSAASGGELSSQTLCARGFSEALEVHEQRGAASLVACHIFHCCGTCEDDATDLSK